MIALLVAVTIVVSAAPAPVKLTYALQARVAYLEAALSAVEKAPREVLMQAHGNLAVYERGQCADGGSEVLGRGHRRADRRAAQASARSLVRGILAGRKIDRDGVWRWPRPRL